MKDRFLFFVAIFYFTISGLVAQEGNEGLYQSIRSFGVLPENSADVNKINLQKAIDWAATCGAALYVEPVETPYKIAGGIILKKNVSLIGVHGPVPRGTKSPAKLQPVGSVFAISDTRNPFMTVRGNEKCTISMFGCRMRDYRSDLPITILNPNAVIQAEGCLDKKEEPFRLPAESK